MHPHLLKLLQNHLLDDRLILPSGKFISKKLIEHILANDNVELKLHSKLQLKHITVIGQERQNVRCAAQLFSHHTAEAIRRICPPDAGEAADFFELVNNTFDVLNPRVQIDNNKFRCGFGANYSEQISLLNSFRLKCVPCVKYFNPT